MKKGSKVVLVIILVLLIASSAIGITFGVMSMKEIKNLKSQVERQNKDTDEENVDNENVLIGGGYQILSTKNISDAYISGDSSKLNEEDKKTLELASNVLKEIITEDMSAYDKEKQFMNGFVRTLSTIQMELLQCRMLQISRQTNRCITVKECCVCRLCYNL